MQVNGTGQRPDINQLLDQMRSMRQEAQGQAIQAAGNGIQAGVQGVAGLPPGSEGVPATGVVQGAGSLQRPSFTDTLGQALNQVNATQMQAGAAQSAFVSGERSDLVNVMVAVQKANVSFQAVTQVRNRLVEAYKDVMNMPI